MEQQKAMSEINSRVRDFRSWLPTEKARQEHPLPVEDASLDEKVSYLQATLPIIMQADRHSWSRGGWKEVELEQALNALGKSLYK